MRTDSTPRFLVTAGNTRERIDKVRDWGNIFTGNTGFSIARALAEVGDVDLLTSNQSHLQQIAASADQRLRGFSFNTHADLMTALEDRMHWTRYDGIFMTAAVSDYTPARVFEVISRQDDTDSAQQRWIVRDVQAGKVKSYHGAIAVLGTPTKKIVDCFRSPWGHAGLLVKFKLEVGINAAELIAIGQRSRVASGAEFLVANTLDMVEGPAAGAYLLSDAGEEFVLRKELANRLAILAAGYVLGRQEIPPVESCPV